MDIEHELADFEAELERAQGTLSEARLENKQALEQFFEPTKRQKVVILF
jgi:hypothetical protein